MVIWPVPLPGFSNIAVRATPVAPADMVNAVPRPVSNKPSPYWVEPPTLRPYEEVIASIKLKEPVT